MEKLADKAKIMDAFAAVMADLAVYCRAQALSSKSAFKESGDSLHEYMAKFYAATANGLESKK